MRIHTQQALQKPKRMPSLPFATASVQKKQQSYHSKDAVFLPALFQMFLCRSGKRWTETSATNKSCRHWS